MPVSKGLQTYWTKERIKKFSENSKDCENSRFVETRTDPTSKKTCQMVMCGLSNDSCRMNKCPIIDKVLKGKNKKKS